MSVKCKIKKGDDVIVVTGKNKGKVGTVLKVMPLVKKLLVDGINVAKKHSKPNKSFGGGINVINLPIDISNVAFFDKESGRGTKIGFKLLDDGSKVRFAKSSGRIISN